MDVLNQSDWVELNVLDVEKAVEDAGGGSACEYVGGC